jgi:hypothetical protein
MVPSIPHTEFENADIESIESSRVPHFARLVFQVGSENLSGFKQ